MNNVFRGIEHVGQNTGTDAFIDSCIFHLKFIKCLSMVPFLIDWFFLCILEGAEIKAENESMKQIHIMNL